MNKSGIVLHSLLVPGSIQLNLLATTRDEVLDELVRLIPEISTNPEFQQTLLRALQEREKLHSTGIGSGVALPHARSALVGIVDRPVIAFGRHRRGIPFGAIDGEPTRLFFLLVAPTVTTHLGILARISRILHDSRIRQDLLLAETGERVLQLIRSAEEKS